AGGDGAHGGGVQLQRDREEALPLTEDGRHVSCATDAEARARSSLGVGSPRPPARGVDGTLTSNGSSPSTPPCPGSPTAAPRNRPQVRCAVVGSGRWPGPHHATYRALIRLPPSG